MATDEDRVFEKANALIGELEVESLNYSLETLREWLEVAREAINTRISALNEEIGD